MARMSQQRAWGHQEDQSLRPGLAGTLDWGRGQGQDADVSLILSPEPVLY